MNYSLNLFGYQAECTIHVVNGKLTLELSDEVQKGIYSYLIRTLGKYGVPVDRKTTNFYELVQKAIEIEKTLGGHMVEPKIKLPYEFAPETKEKLIIAADKQNISATQLLIRLIENKYQSVFGDPEEN